MNDHPRFAPRALALFAGTIAALAVAPAVRAGVPIPRADVGIEKTQKSPSPAQPGNVITYSITVSNAGPNSAANVEWTDTTPPGTTLDEFTPPAGVSCTYPSFGSPGTIDCTLTSSLGVGASAGPYEFELNVPNGYSGGVVVNTAHVTSSIEDDNPDNDSSTVTTPVAGSDIPTLSGAALVGLAAAVSLAGLSLLRR
ncbi:MAG TPA: DUF11 domain-containing protein [Thermoanaerobaculia bacterium]|nr:DUF11 domain-containing protein [Thermoanaerobaculia bacterium]